jgi:CHAT domain-containing protein
MMRLRYWGLAFLSCALCLMLLLPAGARVVIDSAASTIVPGDRDHPTLLDSDDLDRGQQLYQSGRFAEAAAQWRQAAQQFATTGQTPGQIQALRYLGIVYQDLDQWDAAAAAIAQAQSLLQSHPEPLLQAQLRLTQGSLQLNQGQGAEALATWTIAEQLYGQIKDDRGVFLSQLNQVEALQSLGFYGRSRALIDQINRTLAIAPDSDLKARSLRSLGRILRRVGDLPEAKRALVASLTLEDRDRDSLAMTLIELGDVTREDRLANPDQDQSQDQTALAFYQKAAETAQSPRLVTEAALRRFRLQVGQPMSRGPIGVAQLPQIQAQIQVQVEALAAGRSGIYSRINFAESLRLLGGQSGDQPGVGQPLAIAESILGQALAQAKSLGDRRAESYVLGQMGAIAEAQSRWPEALALTREARKVASLIQADDGEASWLWQEGRLLKAQGQIDGAIKAYGQAVEHVQSLRQDLVAMNPEVQFSFRDRIEPIYREFVQLLLIDVDRLPAALKQDHLERSRQTLEALQLAQLQNFFRQACQTYRPQPLETLDPHAALVYSISLADRLEVILSLPGQPLQHYSSPLTTRETETLARSLRQSLNPAFPAEEGRPAAQRLYDALLRPAEAALAEQGIKTLVFVLDDAWRNLPMAVLHDGDRYLVERYSLALTPGLQLFAGKPIAAARPALLLGGLSEANQGFGAIPAVGQELQRLQTLGNSLGKTELLLNQNFTQTSLVKALQQPNLPIVHLATHGQFSSRAQDTFLLTWNQRLSVQTLGQWLDRRTGFSPIELLVLSACQTAKGDNRATLGLAGIAVRSGARSTLATLWAVQDQSTSAFMAAFYQGLLTEKRPRAEALRQAQLTFVHDAVNPRYQHPYYWAPFVLVGSWD